MWSVRTRWGRMMKWKQIWAYRNGGWENGPLRSMSYFYLQVGNGIMRKNCSWWSSHFIETRINELYHLYQPEQSAGAGKSIHLAHSIKHSNTSILVMELRRRHQFIREAIQIELYPNNMKMQDRFSLSRSLKQKIISKDKLILHYKTIFLYLGPWKTSWFLTSTCTGLENVNIFL